MVRERHGRQTSQAARRGDGTDVRGLTRHGSAGRGYDAAEVDLGNEPPLSIGAKTEEAPLRRSISVRWLTGTILTGFTSIFLMGGALMAALNNPNQFAVLPDVADARRRRARRSRSPVRPEGRPHAADRGASRAGRSSRSPPSRGRASATSSSSAPSPRSPPASACPSPRSPSKSRPITRSPSSPTTRRPTRPAGQPAGTPADDQFYGANVDGEVSVKVTDFPLDNADGRRRRRLRHRRRRAGRARRRQLRSRAGDGGGKIAALPYVDPTRFNEDGVDDPFSALGVRITPENVSNIAKSDAGDAPEHRRRGEGHRRRQGRELPAAPPGERRQRRRHRRDRLRPLRPDRPQQAACRPEDPGRLSPATAPRAAKPDPIRVSIYDDGAHQATVARTDDNSFVRADEPNADLDDFAAATAPRRPPAACRASTTPSTRPRSSSRCRRR